MINRVCQWRSGSKEGDEPGLPNEGECLRYMMMNRDREHKRPMTGRSYEM